MTRKPPEGGAKGKGGRAREPSGTAPNPRGSPRAKGSRARKWGFRLAALTLVPAAFLLAAEVVLRLAGQGYPTGFFIEGNQGGRSVWIENQRFGWRFFPRHLARTPQPLVLPKEKPQDSYRIFILGESAAMGDPKPAFGLARMLEVLLHARYPGSRFEVVNAAMTAINSHVIVPIAEDCSKQAGDLWIIYMGNNEVVGPFGAGTIFGAQTPGRAFIKANLLAKELRLVQLLDGMLGHFLSRAEPNTWAGLEMFLSQQVRYDDPRLERVYESFKRNLEDIIRLGIDSGAKVIASTVCGNLKDCAPFGSLHPPDFPASRAAEWEQLYRAGAALEDSGKTGEAQALYQQAAKIDGQFAELEFRLGRCHAAAGQSADARLHHEQAREFDTLRFRADSRINRIIRETAGNRPGEGVYLVDSSEALDRLSPREIPGLDLFYDHVHLNFAGTYALARALADQAAQLLPAAIARRSQPGGDRPGDRPGDWLSIDVCAERLGFTSWHEQQVVQEVRRRLASPPFTGQLNHSAQDEFFGRRAAELRAKLGASGLRQAIETCSSSLAHAEGDWVLHENLGNVLEAAGDVPRAIAAWKRVAELVPQYSNAYYHLGNLHDIAGQSATAQGYFETALRILPRMVESLNGLGLALAAQGKHEEAYARYAQALRINPGYAAAHVNWGLGLAGQRRFEEAKIHYEEAIRLNPGSAYAHYNLGKVLAAQGKEALAAPFFSRAVELKGDFTAARFDLGLELARQGNRSAASEHFREILRIQPGSAGAHLHLGILLEEEGRAAEAMRYYLEACRLEPNNRLAQERLQAVRSGQTSPPP